MQWRESRRNSSRLKGHDTSVKHYQPRMPGLKCNGARCQVQSHSTTIKHVREKAFEVTRFKLSLKLRAKKINRVAHMEPQASVHKINRGGKTHLETHASNICLKSTGGASPLQAAANRVGE